MTDAPLPDTPENLKRVEKLRDEMRAADARNHAEWDRLAEEMKPSASGARGKGKRPLAAARAKRATRRGT